jgi:hypothetical protein
VAELRSSFFEDEVLVYSLFNNAIYTAKVIYIPMLNKYRVTHLKVARTHEVFY